MHTNPPYTTTRSRKNMITQTPPLTLQRVVPRPLLMAKDEFILCLKLLSAEGIDPPNRCCTAPERRYRVVFSGDLEPLGNELWSRVAAGYPNPSWNARWDVRFEDYPWDNDSSRLRVEVLGFFSYGEEGPETSTGMSVVGRAEVPLPKKLCKQKFHKLQLLRPEGDKYKAEGTIGVSLEVMPLIEAERRDNKYMWKQFMKSL